MLLSPKQAALPPAPNSDPDRYETAPLLNHRAPLLGLTITFMVGDAPFPPVLPL